MIWIDEVVEYDGNTVWTKINSRLLNMEPDILAKIWDHMPREEGPKRQADLDKF